MWKDAERVLMCLFSMTAAKQKTVMQGGSRARYIRAHRTPVKRLLGRNALTNRAPYSLPWAASTPRSSASQAITGFTGLHLFKGRNRKKKAGQRFGNQQPLRLINIKGISAQNKRQLFEGVAALKGGGIVVDSHLMIHLDAFKLSMFVGKFIC